MLKYTLAALALITVSVANTGSSTEGTNASGHNAPVAVAQGEGHGAAGQPAAASEGEKSREEAKKTAEEGKEGDRGHSTQGGSH